MNNHVIQSLQQLFIRDLLKLRQEISSYINEEKIWHIEKKISNSAGNLCLHLVGNLNTYIGAELGRSGYIRNRDLEFTQKDLSKEELIRRIDETTKILEKTLNALDDEILLKEYPQIVFKDKMTTGYFLIHLAGHLNYHLGQVNYHRRLLDQKKSNSLLDVYARTFC